MPDLDLQEARALLARVLERAPEEVTDDASIATTAGWDSLAHVRMVLAVEEHVGRDLIPEEVLSLTSLPGIARAMA